MTKTDFFNLLNKLGLTPTNPNDNLPASSSGSLFQWLELSLEEPSRKDFLIRLVRFLYIEYLADRFQTAINNLPEAVAEKLRNLLSDNSDNFIERFPLGTDLGRFGGMCAALNLPRALMEKDLFLLSLLFIGQSEGADLSFTTFCNHYFSQTFNF